MKKLLGLMVLWLVAMPLAAEDWQVTLRPGDSLWALCERLERQPAQCWQELAAHNGLENPNRLAQGIRVRVPIDWLNEKPVPATLEAVRGEVMLYPADGGPTRPLRNGDTVRFGDALETAGDGSARLRFADQTLLTVQPGSLLVVNSYRRFLKQAPEDTELKLKRGGIRSQVTPQSSDQIRHRIYTPGAVAAVRGTVYDIRVDQYDTARSEVLEGAVEVSAQGLSRDLPKGYATLAAFGEVPAEPRPMLPAPSLVLSEQPGQIEAVWPAQADAQQYWLELYSQPEQALLDQYTTEADRWQQSLSPGNYQLRARAVDKDGLRGHETVKNFTVSEQEPEPEPEPVVEVEEEEPSDWSLWAFLGAALLLLAL